GLMLTTGVVGSGLPIAAGLAWAAARQGEGRVTVASFGDGATNIGAFHEAADGAVSVAVARARAGEGPTLVEAVTDRLFGHVFGDRMTYVDPKELEEAWKREPVARFRRTLVE